MSTVKELMLSPAGTAAEPVDAEVDVLGEDAAEVAGVEDGALVDDELDDEQPAAVRAASATATPATPTRRKPRDLRLPCEWEDPPPPVLIPSPIPNFPSLERARMSRCGTPYSSCVPTKRKHASQPRTSAITW
jgi:hypothetical protein